MPFFLATLLCLGLFTLSAAAQETTSSFMMNPDGTSTMRILESGKEEAVYSISQKGTKVLLAIGVEEPLFAEMQGKMTGLRFLGREEDVAVYQAALGMTAEQVALMAQKRAESQERFREFEQPFLETITRFDELSPEEAVDFEDKVRSMFREGIDAEHAILPEVLTPAQLQRMQELELVLPSRIFNFLGGAEAEPFLNLKAYETLELSEEQKESLAKMQQEFGKEVADFQKSMIQDMFKFLADGKEPSNEMLKPYMEKAKALRTRIKARTLSLLTKEQTAKLEKILADWPKKLEQIRADWKAKQEKKTPADDSWRDAWKPGDPVPEGAVPPRQRKAFPF